MMIILRVLPSGSRDELWHKLAEIVPGLKVLNATALFMSQNEHRDHVNVVFDARSYDAIVPVFCEHLATCRSVFRTMTAPLLKPLFFPVPRERPEGLKRFRLALQVRTANIAAVYRQISTKTYYNGVFPTYQAFSLGQDDIVLTFLTATRQLAETEASNMSRLEGVLKADLASVDRNLRIASREEWQRYRESHYAVAPPATADREFDWLDAAMSGAFVAEF